VVVRLASEGKRRFVVSGQNRTTVTYGVVQMDLIATSEATSRFIMDSFDIIS
jgi:hypothetical protein